MDPISLIVNAISVGAISALRSTAEQSIKDAYLGFKYLIQKKYGNISLDGLEGKPESQSKKDSLAEDLVDSGASDDMELLDRAKELLDLIKMHDSQSIALIGIDLQKIEADYIRIKEVHSSGSGIRGQEWKIRGGIEIEGVNTGQTEKKI